MATTPEGKVKDKAKKLYQKYRAKYDRAAQTGMGRNGRADDIVCRRPDGRFIGIEVKKLAVFDVTKLQQDWLVEVEDCGGCTMVLNMTTLPLLELVLSKQVLVHARFEKLNKGARCTGHVVTNMKTGEQVFMPAGGSDG